MLYFISCGKAKLAKPAKAKDLYTGGLFRKSRAFVERKNAPYYILSALHGVVHPDQVIDPYEAILTAKNKAAWSKMIIEQLNALGLAKNTPCISIAPHLYTLPLKLYFEQVEEPLKGLGIGKRMKWLT